MCEVDSEQVGSQTGHSGLILVQTHQLQAPSFQTEVALNRYCHNTSVLKKLADHYPEKAICLRWSTGRPPRRKGLWPLLGPLHTVEHRVTDFVCLKWKNKTRHTSQGIAVLRTNLDMFEVIPYSKRRPAGVFR